MKQEYSEKEFKEWDGKTPLVLRGTDEYFFDCHQLLDFMADTLTPIDNFEFMLCEPQYASGYEVDPDDIFFDILPQDMSLAEMAPKLCDAFAALNKAIDDSEEVISWTESCFRTTVTREMAERF
jgi:hypothetical protein